MTVSSQAPHTIRGVTKLFCLVVLALGIGAAGCASSHQGNELRAIAIAASSPRGVDIAARQLFPRKPGTSPCRISGGAVASNLVAGRCSTVVAAIDGGT